MVIWPALDLLTEILFEKKKKKERWIDESIGDQK